ncbi:MAG: YbaB/EbfC family nucleoid-associated protein [Clostridiaceae bacterium]|jgi:DNA-binding YbaB/EbfC family protein|nr:YbaB/EbfC family nucleoid-associated protein [Clostridiaceae bacterium]
MKARIPGQPQGGGNMMKRLQEMQANMEAKQAELAEAEYTASSGGGAVDVTVNGSHEVVSIKIQPDVVDPEDVEMLEDMLIAALNEAMRKADETAERELGQITGGLNIPGMGGMF